MEKGNLAQALCETSPHVGLPPDPGFYRACYYHTVQAERLAAKLDRLEAVSRAKQRLWEDDPPRPPRWALWFIRLRSWAHG